MAARIDPFVDVLLREQGDQLYLLPDEPVTMVKDGKPRKVSRQPLTDQHIYALLVEVAPSESADHIDQMTETEFEYIRSEEHTSELQSRLHLVCRLLLEKKKRRANSKSRAPTIPFDPAPTPATTRPRALEYTFSCPTRELLTLHIVTRWLTSVTAKASPH